jgi:Cu2+-exporting ATPase
MGDNLVEANRQMQSAPLNLEDPTLIDDNACYHCGLPVDQKNLFTLKIQNVERHFCCAGCQAVAGLIHDGGLDQFYEYRSKLNVRADERVADYTLYDREDIQSTFVVADEQSKTAHLLLDNITCAACVWLIEKYMYSLDGVTKVRVNAVTHQCSITWDTDKQSLSFLMQQLLGIGYRPQPFTRQEQYKQQKQRQQTLLLRLGVAGFGMMQVGMVAVALYAGDIQGIDSQWVQLLRWVSLLVATPVVLFSAQPFWTSAWRSLKSFFAASSLRERSHYLTMDVPVSLAILLAYFASAWATITQTGEVYFDSISMFTFFLLLGRYLEVRLRYRNQQTMGMMTDLLPITVTRIMSSCIDIESDQLQQFLSKKEQQDSAQSAGTPKKTEFQEIIPLVELSVGDVIQVYSGDTIPCDGTVLEGRSAVVESILTGEAEPVIKVVNDAVIAGTLNTEGSLLVKVTAVGEQTRLSAISQLVQEAEQDKPAVQQIADHVASYFVAAVLLVSIIVFTSWYFIEPQSALWVTLSVLVVTCPCALSLATPTALTAAAAVMRQQGLLVLKGHVTETLTKIQKVIFDKTGTLTYGRPVIKQTVILQEGYIEKDILAIAAALEQGSSHPIAKAFNDYQGLKKAVDIELTTGAGVSGKIDDDNYRLGKPAFVLDEHSLKTSSLPRKEGQWILLSRNYLPVAYIELSDDLRESAFHAVNDLRRDNISIEVLSGDHQSAVAKVADTLGIDAHANQTPEDKLNYISAQQKQNRVIMVGDGINDVPVLAGADVSVAMDSATDFARVHADSVLLRSDLSIIPKAINTAKRAKIIIQQNLAWALGYNILALPLAACGFIPPYLAAIGMSASSLIVVVNALRLYK